MESVVAFVDESFSAPTSDSYFVAVVAVFTNDRRSLELTIRRIRKKRVQARSEFKAAKTPHKIIREFLVALASEPNLSITAAIWESKRTEVGDFEALYRQLVSRVALMVVKKHKRVDLVLDKRYSHKQSRDELELEIRRNFAFVRGNVVRILQEDSQRVTELAAADFIAWAFMQHYCKGISEYYNLIRSKVVHLDNLSQ